MTLEVRLAAKLGDFSTELADVRLVRTAGSLSAFAWS